MHVSKQGRKRCFRLFDEKIFELLIMLGGRPVTQAHVPEPPRWDFVQARKCMDHSAGKLGVGMAGAMRTGHHVMREAAGGRATNHGEKGLRETGVDVTALRHAPRHVLRLCQDRVGWGLFLGGSLGAALMRLYVDKDWVRREGGSGDTRITPKGKAAFQYHFDLDMRGATM